MLQRAINEGNPIDVVLLDNNMPGVTGLELLARMREQQMLRDTHVIMCTTSHYDKDEKLAKSLGAAGYLTKPPQFSLLKDIIDRCQNLRLSQDDGDPILLRAT